MHWELRWLIITFLDMQGQDLEDRNDTFLLPRSHVHEEGRSTLFSPLQVFVSAMLHVLQVGVHLAKTQSDSVYLPIGWLPQTNRDGNRRLPTPKTIAKLDFLYSASV